MLEVVLHNADDEDVIRSFLNYEALVYADVHLDKRRDIGLLTFLPVEVSTSNVV